MPNLATTLSHTSTSSASPPASLPVEPAAAAAAAQQLTSRVPTAALSSSDDDEIASDPEYQNATYAQPQQPQKVPANSTSAVANSQNNNLHSAAPAAAATTAAVIETTTPNNNAATTTTAAIVEAEYANGNVVDGLTLNGQASNGRDSSAVAGPATKSADAVVATVDVASALAATGKLNRFVTNPLGSVFCARALDDEDVGGGAVIAGSESGFVCAGIPTEANTLHRKLIGLHACFSRLDERRAAAGRPLPRQGHVQVREGGRGRAELRGGRHDLRHRVRRSRGSGE